MRLDLFVFEKFQLKSRTFAENLIKKGLVTVNGVVAEKTSVEVSDDDDITVNVENEFESLGGDKLQKALDRFNINITGLIAADIGASNGGFTDCMLRAGVKKVYAVDVCECAFSERLKNDGRVVVRDKLNAREIKVSDLGERVDFISVDVSFISLKLILPAVFGLLNEGGRVVALVKPQFELGHRAGKSGIVLNAKERYKTLTSVISFCNSQGFVCKNVCSTPRNFKNKNIEYLVLLSRNDGNSAFSALSFEDFSKID